MPEKNLAVSVTKHEVELFFLQDKENGKAVLKHTYSIEMTQSS